MGRLTDSGVAFAVQRKDIYESKDPRVKRLRQSCKARLAGAKQYFDTLYETSRAPGYNAAALGDLNGVWGGGNYHDILPTIDSTEAMIRWSQGASRAGRGGAVYVLDLPNNEYCFFSDQIYQAGALLVSSIGVHEFGTLRRTGDQLTLSPFYSVAVAGNPTDDKFQLVVYPNTPRTYALLTMKATSGWYPNLTQHTALALDGPNHPYMYQFFPKRAGGPRVQLMLLRAK
jgi:hypothetical protein